MIFSHSTGLGANPRRAGNGKVYTMALHGKAPLKAEEAPIRAATGCRLGRERMPAAELPKAPRPRGHPVAALSGSMEYARILAIGGHLGKSPHFYVAHPSLSLVLTNTWYVTASQSHAEAITA